MKHPRSHCPIAFALDIFGDRWSLLILRDVLFLGKRHYHEFLASGEGISTNILASRLSRLEKEGLIAKSRDSQNRRRYVYAPTQKGMELLPVMLEIIRWSARYDPQTAAPAAFMRRLKQDPEALKHEILAKAVKPSR